MLFSFVYEIRQAHLKFNHELCGDEILQVYNPAKQFMFCVNCPMIFKSALGLRENHGPSLLVQSEYLCPVMGLVQAGMITMMMLMVI